MNEYERSMQSADDAGYFVIASVRPSTLPRLREALSNIVPLTVTASHATDWGSGRKLTYRGVTFGFSDPIVRLEITCERRHVDWILRAIGKLLDTDAARGPSERVVAIPAHALVTS